MRTLLVRQTARRKGRSIGSGCTSFVDNRTLFCGTLPSLANTRPVFLTGASHTNAQESRVAYYAQGRCLIEGNQTFLIGDTQRQSLIGAVGRADVGDAYSCAPRRQCLELDNGHSH